MAEEKLAKKLWSVDEVVKMLRTNVADDDKIEKAIRDQSRKSDASDKDMGGTIAMRSPEGELFVYQYYSRKGFERIEGDQAVIMFIISTSVAEKFGKEYRLDA